MFNKNFLLLLASSFMAVSGHAGENLGNVMYVGDSLTNGAYTPLGYRYQLMKIFVDNGTLSKSTGVWKTTQAYGDAATTYRGVSFRNNDSVCAFSGRRASQTAGTDNRGGGGTGTGNAANSSIGNWLGLNDKQLDGKTPYQGTVLQGNTSPDFMFVLLGTNDMVTNHENNFSSSPEQTAANVQTIVRTGQQANAAIQAVIMSVPVWSGEGTGYVAAANTRQIKNNVDSYNRQMAEWAGTQNNVRFIDINRGIIDVTNKNGLGVDGMYYKNGRGETGLHFSEQGNLIIAGNIARGLGMEGRTAGQERKEAASFSRSFQGASMTVDGLKAAGFTQKGNVSNSANGLVFAHSGCMTASWAAGEAQSGFTVDISLQLQKSSATELTPSNAFSLQLGNGTVSGTLTVSEAFIKWGDSILYSMDATQESNHLRISYLAPGQDSDAASSGFYIWLGDQLIGEACLSDHSGFNGLSLGSGNAALFSLATDGSGSYAPVSNIPEPSAALLFCTALSGAFFLRRKQTAK